MGIGPSSSHTLGPWKAAAAFIEEIMPLEAIGHLECHLYGSLALTGYGHGTNIAILLGLSGELPEKVDVEKIYSIPEEIKNSQTLHLGGSYPIAFSISHDLRFHPQEFLDFHPNGLRFVAKNREGMLIQESTYFSIGGGFIVKEGKEASEEKSPSAFHFESAATILKFCDTNNWSISDLALQNERTWHTDAYIENRLDELWEVMAQSAYRGCHIEGILPGGLNVVRRAPGINRKLLTKDYPEDYQSWTSAIREERFNFAATLKWVSCFAMAVNEENANFGRIVTAPTNGAAGVIPAVLQYHICFADSPVEPREIHRFLLTAASIGSIFKQQATISAAMGGCQAEIGVSSSMAAAALTEALGGTPRQALIAAEIAMEHHLGMTCDPIKGLVQVPCIERNCMGAVKAITAANLALETDPEKVKVSLDAVVKTMWETALDMNHKYKETSLGGLATNVIEC